MIITFAPAQPPDALLADIDHMKDIFNFTVDQLGARTCQAFAHAVMFQMDLGCDPDGQPWPALSDSYRAWKITVAPGAPIGVLYGHMRDMMQLEGEQQIERFLVRQTYGIDALAKTEALKFQLGGIITGTNQPQRPFYEIGSFADAMLTQHFDAHWAKQW